MDIIFNYLMLAEHLPTWLQPMGACLLIIAPVWVMFAPVLILDLMQRRAIRHSAIEAIRRARWEA